MGGTAMLSGCGIGLMQGGGASGAGVAGLRGGADTSDGGSDGSSDSGDTLLDKADLVGTITAITDTGFTVQAGTLTADMMTVGADGAEADAGASVEVVAGGDTVYERVDHDMAAGILSDPAAISRDELARNALVYLYGIADGNRFNATRVIVEVFV